MGTSLRLTAVVLDQWPSAGPVWEDEDGRQYLSDAQMSDLAALVPESPILERRLTGGWLAREPRQEPLTVPRINVAGEDYFRISGDWLRLGSQLPG